MSQVSPAPRPLDGIKVVEVAMWAFVPACGGILSSMGADVIKIEPPTGDPLRGLKIGALASGEPAFDYSWENYNRGKRSITLDLRTEAGVEVLYKLLDGADVFLTNLLPAARRRMKIDEATIRSRFPEVIYAVGSALGRHGPESEKGGYDAITFWARSGIAAATTPEDMEYPVGLPGAAFGDCASASTLAGGICAAIAQKARTGHVSSVDVSLLNVGMWSMQRGITQATKEGVLRFPRPPRNAKINPLTNMYKTSDGRVVQLNMLQSDRYWPGLCRVIERPDLLEDPRFDSDAKRNENAAELVAIFEAVFALRPLAEWREILARQDGQWDAVQYVGELKDDTAVQANGYLQPVDYGDGRGFSMVSVPMQFDGRPCASRPAPEMGADSDAILAELGYDEDGVIQLKIDGVVF
jgi:crotonobetainyl-CoA:carnitine CoA-transferase CaiB-like acyl-CoA transferase